MKPSITVFLFVLSAFLLGACKSSEMVSDEKPGAPMSMEQELVQKHIEAQGGIDAIRAINSVRISGEVEMPSVGMTMPMIIHQKRPAKMHAQVMIPAMGAEVINAFDGETAWEINPMEGGTRKITGTRARDFREQADLDGMLVDYEAKGYTLELMGEEDVMGTMTKKLKVTRADSSSLFVYLDAATHLITMSEAEGTNPMTGGSTTVKTRMLDYRDVAGMQMPHVLEISLGGQVFQKMTLSEIEVNVEVEDTLFAYPEK